MAGVKKDHIDNGASFFHLKKMHGTYKNSKVLFCRCLSALSMTRWCASSVFKAKVGYDGLISGSSQFSLLPSSIKNETQFKIDSKIIILLRLVILIFNIFLRAGVISFRDWMLFVENFVFKIMLNFSFLP